MIDDIDKATLFALREVRKRMYIGIKESEARDMMRSAMSASGISESDCLVLFGGWFLRFVYNLLYSLHDKRMLPYLMEVEQTEHSVKMTLHYLIAMHLYMDITVTSREFVFVPLLFSFYTYTNRISVASRLLRWIDP